ncbi:MAG: hypothetical protein RL754_1421 [Bacteroidota bacterium]|jgi:putative hydrolase of the HAD superfamily
MITQIWFDFGNIFIPIFPQRTRERMEDCGVQLNPEAFDALNIEFEKGLISEGEFLQELSTSCKYLQSSRCVELAWNALLGDLHDNVLMLGKLKHEYNLALVSNTNPTHINHIRKTSGPFLWNQFIEKFDGHFFSYEIGCRKPEFDYFDHVLAAMDTLPENVLFIDDSQQNIEAAQQLGLHTWQFNIHEGDLAKELPAVLAKLNEGATSVAGV